jgi:hypothetical protein
VVEGYQLSHVWTLLREIRAAEDKTPMSLYDELTAAGIPTDNHESDLYFPATDASRAILAKHPDKQGTAETFVNKAPPHVGELWYDVPFAYTPWWDKRAAK